MKKNRSNEFTTGLCNTFEGIDQRTLFFEVDSYDPKTELYNINYFHEIHLVKDVFYKYQLDHMFHNTQNGIHFLSPTMISKQLWLKIIKEDLKDVNKKCPMTTLRVEPNKYPNELEFWYRFSAVYKLTNIDRNNYNMSNYLNRIFRTEFHSLSYNAQDIKIVRYPLPEAR